MHSDDDPLLRTIPEACKRVRLSKATIYRLIASGRLEAVKVGSLTRIRESELRRFVEELAPARR